MGVVPAKIMSPERDATGEVSWQPTTSAFERSSKRRKGFPSEQQVKKGDRVVGGSKELIRETWPQRPMSLRVLEIVSETVA
jgi:hypothetical protein